MGNSDCHDWVRLEVLILRRACTLLRKLFRRRWKQSESTDWSDCPTFGQQFVNGLGSHIYQTCGRLHRLTLEEGDINNWDFTMLSRILQEAGWKVPENMKSSLKEENKRLSQLISFRNKATQHQTKSLDDLEFCRYWDEIEKILVSFGESEKQLEELKLTPSISEDSLLSSSIMSGDDDNQRPVSPEHISEARRLKDEAKSVLNSNRVNKIDHALDCLSTAISLDGLPEMELSVLYTSRSEAFLRKAASVTNNTEGRKEIAYLALKDAKQALNMRPAWGLAHYRVGKAYVELGKLKKATKFLDQALDLEPEMDEIKKARKTCDLRLIEFERASSSSGMGSSRGTTPDGDVFDDFDPTAKTFPPSLQPTYLPGATRLSPIVQHCMDRLFFDWEDRSNPLADIYRAHKLRDGVDVKRNYREAAQLYRKGVKSQNAEAMYNLALLKLHGHGVKHDVAGAIQLLKRASKQPYKVCKGTGSNFVSNVGVGESEFLLGLLNYIGYGFPQRDAFSAAHWYADATDHGSGPAAHNLAVLHFEGKAIVKNEDRAIQLWKLGSARGVLHSMVALAVYCLKNWQTEQARCWLNTAYDMDPHEVQDDFPLSAEEQDEMNQTMHQIDLWRSKYTLREINKWETQVGLGSTRSISSSANKNSNGTSSANLRPRIVRMLRRLEHEKEKIGKVEEYLASVRPKPVIMNFPKGEYHDRSQSRNSSNSDAYSTSTSRLEREKSCDTTDAKSDKGSIGSNAGGDSGIES